MDFFGLQEDARRQRRRLLALFSLVVAAASVSVWLACVATAVLFGLGGGADQALAAWWNPRAFLMTSLVTALIIAMGAWWRMRTLRAGGGAAVARMLGGEPVPAHVRDPLLRRLRNVVAEMAVASGMPPPKLWVLPEEGINAFAAGFTSADAVIAVTRGALESLHRDELQGVVAHEFAHLVNGDARLKMRMMGLLHGVTMLSDGGIRLMSLRVRDRRGREGVHPVLFAGGFFLFLFGTLGLVLADLVKRAVSRQREFLADAMAVQFTRHPEGLANALKVIGGWPRGSRVHHPGAMEASHFFFGAALRRWHGGWWSSHPPLEERIRRLDPAFRGDLSRIDASHRRMTVLAEAEAAMMVADTAARGADAGALAPVARQADALLASAGQANPAAARRALAGIPSALRLMAQDALSAPAVVLALLLSGDSAVRRRQIAALKGLLAGSEGAGLIRDLLEAYATLRRLDAVRRVSLADLCLPALREMNPARYPGFRRAVNALIRADGSIDAFEFLLHRLLKHHLDAHFEPRKADVAERVITRMEELAGDAAIVLAMLVRHGRHEDPRASWRAAVRMLGEDGALPEWMPAREDWKRLDRALGRLGRAAPDLKRRIMRACIAAVLADGRVRPAEYELLRATAVAMGVPMPPLDPD
ncbi:MAG: M48 family metalloprotease [Mariprofundaceae bacterium]